MSDFTILCGHATEKLRELPDESVQLVVCSPPYWQKRTYKTEPQNWPGEGEPCPDEKHSWADTGIRASRGNNLNQRPEKGLLNSGWEGLDYESTATTGEICSVCHAWRGELGHEPHPEMFARHLVSVFDEVKRVLREDGLVFVNIMDSYTGSGAHYPDHKNPGITRSGARLGAVHTPTPEEIGPQQQAGIPSRFAFAMQESGWVWRHTIIWAKGLSYCEKACPCCGTSVRFSGSSMPESTESRPSTSHEYILMFAKSNNSVFWTHRDYDGTRVKPRPDFGWCRATGQEVTEEPEDWKISRITCPDCLGTGKVAEDGDPGIFNGTLALDDCERCENGNVPEWRRVNLWEGHNYFYDGYAVREPSGSGPSDLKKMAEHRKRIGGKHKDLEDDPLVAANANTNAGQHRAVGDPSGRNVRSVWAVQCEPSKQAHYAVWPRGLVRPMIRAGSSEAGCCKECGAPWYRAAESAGHINRREPAHVPNNCPTKTDSTGWAPTKRPMDIWRPTCPCNAESIPCVVLDPFCGTGRTGEVCMEENRDFIGIDLSPEYCEMAQANLLAAKKKADMARKQTALGI